jgi:HD-GYP domain-containing protein (c-di-GMP phosphodiesterase class II)
LHWIDSGGPAEVIAAVREIDPGDILVYILYFSDRGTPVDNSAILQRVSEVSPVPVYSFWSFTLADGAMGGSVYDGYSLGLESAQMIRDYLEDGGSWNWYIDEPITRLIIDYPTASRYGLEPRDFPPETQFLRRPVGFFTQHATVILISLSIIAVLMTIIVLIQINLRRQQAINRFNQSLLSTQREIMLNLGNVIERRSRETSDHLKRITALATYLASAFHMSKEDSEVLNFGAALHDVGKVGIPDEILKKRGVLNEEEMAVIRTHPEMGYEILSGSPNEYIRRAAVIAREHHERWDGEGYPRGIRGEEIDILARIVTLADNIDALLTERSYKPAWTAEEVRHYLAEQRGRLFDPRLADLALSNWEEIHRLWKAGGSEELK